MRLHLSRLVNKLVGAAGSPYATLLVAVALAGLDLVLWLTRLNGTVLTLVSLALSQLTVLLLPPILHSTIVGYKATHLKLDALIKAVEGVEDRFMGTEHLSEADIDTLKREGHDLEA